MSVFRLNLAVILILSGLFNKENCIASNSDSSKVNFTLSTEFSSMFYLGSEFNEIKYRFSYEIGLMPNLTMRLKRENRINIGIGTGFLQFNRKNRDLNHFDYYNGVNVLEISNRPYKKFKFNYFILSFRLLYSKKLSERIMYQIGLNFNIYKLHRKYGQTSFENPYYVPYDPFSPNSGPKYGPISESELHYNYQSEFYSSQLINGIEYNFNKHISIQCFVYFDILNSFQLDSGFKPYFRNNVLENNGASFSPIQKIGTLISYRF